MEKTPFFCYTWRIMAKTNIHTPLPLLFVRWYYLEAPLQIVRGYFAYARAFGEIVPFGFLLLTLLSPWKNIVDRTVMHGIDLEKIAEKLSLGLLARLVGCVVRLLTIALGLLSEILLLICAVTFLAFWLAFPIVFVIGISYCIQTL